MSMILEFVRREYSCFSSLIPTFNRVVMELPSSIVLLLQIPLRPREGLPQGVARSGHSKCESFLLETYRRLLKL